jgi:hypothetical protein
MNTNSSTLTGLVVEYDSGIVPAPHSHVFRLQLDLDSNPFQVSLEMHYTDREDLTEDEIYDEGFTLNDDYSFKGAIDTVWTGVFSKAYQAAKWSGKSLNEAGITLTPIEAGKMGKIKVPADQEAWLILSQDLIQAIYETNKKELPLTINYRLVENDSVKDCSITVKFSNREVLFTEGTETRNLNWDYTIQLMKLIFTPDYHYDIAKEEPGKKRGGYINCGDGFWHELGKGVENIDDSFDAVGKIRSGFEDLLS